MEVAREAGEMIRQEFHAGPRGSAGHAPIDHEAEEMIRARLTTAFPEWGYRGEETGSQAGSDPDRWWVVDPQDGTAAFQLGFRGSTVSIGLLERGRPVLGVVFSPTYPDDRGDMIAGLVGEPLTRNGQLVPRRCWDPLGPQSVVIVSQSADKKPGANLRAVAPARIRAMPSVAYRLALVAVGEADGGVSLQNPRAVDVVGGHALLRAAGGELYDPSGQPVSYSDQAEGQWRRCFAGARELCSRDFDQVLARSAEESTALFPTRLMPGQTIADPDLLDRAQGCLLGQLAGDSLGALVEFETAAAIVGRYREGHPRRLEDGGRWNTLAGQPTDDSEMALALARSILERGGYSFTRAYSAYQDWLLSPPFDIGRTTASGLQGRPDVHSQANGSLMRMAPMGLLRDGRACDWAEEDSSLTHPHPSCVSACRAYVAGIQAGLRGESREQMHSRAIEQANETVKDWLLEARKAPPAEFQHQMGWVRIAFTNAFHRLLTSPTLEEALVETVRRGGDTDTNAAICGALLGSHLGRSGVPSQWIRSILSCRPHRDYAASKKPRPAVYWPVDCFELAERLLLVE